MDDTRNTPEQDYIIDHVGAENWQAVLSEYKYNYRSEILRKLREMFPSDSIESLVKLANMIYEAVN